MKPKLTYQELEKENERLRKELAINAKIEEVSLFENILKSSTETSIAATDIDLNIIFFNSKAEEIFGYQVSEVMGKNLTEIHAMEKVDFKRIEDAIEIVRNTGNYEYWVNTERRHLKSNVRGIWTNEKELIGFVLLTNDMTEQINSQKEIEKLSTAVEQSANSIVITDINGNIEYVNSKFTEVTGYTVKEVIGQNPRILKSGEQSANYYTELWKTITAGEIWKGTFKNIAKNGHSFWEQVTITPIKDKNEEITNFLAIKEDITKLKENEDRLKSFINTVPDIICYKDGQGRWLLANDADLELFCLTDVDYFGKTDAELAEYTDSIYKDAFSVCMVSDEIAWTNKTISQGIEVIPTVAGKDMIYDVYKIPTFYSNGNRKGLAVIGRDITELKKTEELLIKAKEKAEESDQLKTEFFHNISHEVRTPMNAILGFSSFLMKENLTDEKRKDYINIIQNSGNQLIRIIDDILEISRLGTKQVKTVEKEVCLNDLLTGYFSIFNIRAKENNISLSLKKGLSDIDSTIWTDDSKLNKIISNLLENAFKFTNKGFIEFGYHLKNNELEIYVKDSGIGIKTESQELIFKRFSQEEKDISKKVGGLGLGLSIAKENAELLHGKITLQSEKGKGSTFFVTIPYKPAKSNNKKRNSDIDYITNTVNQDNFTVLIVEDEHANSLYFKTLLEDFKLNLTILFAKNGQEAVEICKKNLGIDFVLMDIKMPVMNGLEATKLIREFRPKLPIVAQTAYSTGEEKHQAILAGCNDFISKPVSEELLFETINKYLIKNN